MMFVEASANIRSCLPLCGLTVALSTSPAPIRMRTMRHTQSVSIPARDGAEAFTRNRRRASASGLSSLRLGTCQIRIKSEVQGSSTLTHRLFHPFWQPQAAESLRRGLLLQMKRTRVALRPNLDAEAAPVFATSSVNHVTQRSISIE